MGRSLVATSATRLWHVIELLLLILLALQARRGHYPASTLEHVACGWRAILLCLVALTAKRLLLGHLLLLRWLALGGRAHVYLLLQGAGRRERHCLAVHDALLLRLLAKLALVTHDVPMEEAGIRAGRLRPLETISALNLSLGIWVLKILLIRAHRLLAALSLLELLLRLLLVELVSAIEATGHQLTCERVHVVLSVVRALARAQLIARRALMAAHGVLERLNQRREELLARLVKIVRQFLVFIEHLSHDRRHRCVQGHLGARILA